MPVSLRGRLRRLPPCDKITGVRTSEPPPPPPAGGFRVSLSGTFGRGKTSLLRPLAHRLGVPALDEVARRFLDASHDLGTGPVQAAITVVQDRLEAGCTRFVTDRSLIDALAYARIGLAGAAPGTLDHDIFASCSSWCEANLEGRYTEVVLVESEVPLPASLRGREQFRDQVAEEVDRVVRELGVRTLRVVGTPEANARQAAAWIRAQTDAGEGATRSGEASVLLPSPRAGTNT
jgi:hypothetical protein